MTAQETSRATHSLGQILAVVERAALERVQSLAQAALDFVGKTEEEALAAHLADATVTNETFVEAAAARSRLEDLLDIVDGELVLEALGEHRREVRCLGEPISLCGGNPVALGIAARAVEMSPINLAHGRMFPPESRRP